MSRESFRNHADRLRANGIQAFREEFQQVKSRVTSQPGYKNRYTPPCEVVLSRNRYSDIRVLDDTRVKLQTNGNQDYINASDITIDEIQEFKNIKYISAQAPLPEYFDEFWRMCWENEVPIIVMLTPWSEQVENGRTRQKANVYLPLAKTETFSCRAFKITCMDIEKRSTIHGATVRFLNIEHQGEARAIVHVLFVNWPDFGTVVDYESYIEFHKMVEELRAGTPYDKPTLVHCSAGIGRSGTFIAIDMLLKGAQLPDFVHFNVAMLVGHLRNRRPGMVFTVDQYSMIYEIIYYVLFKESFSHGTSTKVDQMENDNDVYSRSLS